MLYSLMQIGRQIRGEINEIVARFNNPSAVQGVTIGYDSYWLEHLKQWMTSQWPWHMPHPEEHRHWIKWLEQFFEHPESFEPPFWHHYLKANGIKDGGGPLIVTFVLRDPKALDQFTESIQRALSGYQVRAEYRPQARGYAMTTGVKAASVGVTVPYRTDGTLGGVIKDRSRPSKQYLVSCAHVLSDSVGTDVYLPSPAKGGGVVANLSFGIMPPPTTTGIQCSKDTTAEYPLDAAAAEIVQTASIPISSRPKVDSVKPIKLMRQGDSVWFTGAASRGRVKGQIRNLCIWHEIEIQKQLHCYGYIFEVEPPKPWYLNTNLAKEGDSGAWILSTDGFSVAWNGMLIGGDGAIVFCSFAEKIMDEFRKAGVDATV